MRAARIAGTSPMAQPKPDHIVSEAAADSSLPSALSAPTASGQLATARSRRRRWYQFSLWSLFALTLLAGLALLGWRWTIAPYREQARTMHLVQRLGGSYQSDPTPKWMSRLAGEPLGDVTL